MIITLPLPGVCHFKLSASHSREGDACHAPRTLTIHSGPGVGGRLPRRRRLARHDDELPAIAAHAAARRAIHRHRTCIRQRAGGARSAKFADHRRQSERLCGRSTPPSRSITAYRRTPRRRPRTRGPTPSPCWACAVSCSGLSSIRSRRRCDCRRGAPTPSRSSSRRRGSPGSRTEVVFLWRSRGRVNASLSSQRRPREASQRVLISPRG